MRINKNRLAVQIVLTSAIVFQSAAPGAALEAGVIAGLRALDPSERLEQRCDIEAMARIDKDKTGYHPDRVVAGATADATVDGDTLTSNGAAFRSKGKWYGLTFTCKGSADHLDVTAFDYTIGDAIPEAQWEQDGLFD